MVLAINQTNPMEESTANNQSIDTLYKECVRQLFPIQLDIENMYANNKTIFIDVFTGKIKITDTDLHNVYNANNANDDEYYIKLEILGIYHYLLKHDYEQQAVSFWRISARANEYTSKIRAVLLLGFYYLKNKRYPRAFKYLKCASEHGWREAMFLLGSYFNYVENNYEKSVEYHKMAVTHGCDRALCALSLHYVDNEQNYGEATKYAVMTCTYGKNEYFEVFIDHIKFALKDFSFGSQVLVFKQIIGNDNLYKHYTRVSSMLDDVFLQWKILCVLEKDGLARSIDIRKSLESNFSVAQYKHKVGRASRYNTLDKCPICLEEPVLNIDIGCFHGVCANCWHPKLKCVYRCKNQMITEKTDDFQSETTVFSTRLLYSSLITLRQMSQMAQITNGDS